jgi:hypothetical protein
MKSLVVLTVLIKQLTINGKMRGKCQIEVLLQSS